MCKNANFKVINSKTIYITNHVVHVKYKQPIKLECLHYIRLWSLWIQKRSGQEVKWNERVSSGPTESISESISKEPDSEQFHLFFKHSQSY